MLSIAGTDHRVQSVAKLIVSRRFVSRTRVTLSEMDNTEPGCFGRNEMDTMADTSCAGPNWRVLELTGTVCDVQGFMNDGNSLKNVPIATCATVAVEQDTGQEIILVGHEMLYFGKKLERSLINQNQLRYAGVKVRDDPTRVKEDGFGLTAASIHIPFNVDGTTVYFESRTPTDQEMASLPHVPITREETWNPKEVDLMSVMAITSQPQEHTRYISDQVLANVSDVL